MGRPTMVFTTYLFVFYFLPLVLVSYYALDGLSRQAGASDGRTCLVLNGFLVLASYIFYGWWDPRFILLMLGITVVNYVCGRIIGLPGIGRRLSFWVATCAIVASLGTLGFFKYFGFFEANLNRVLAWFDAGTVRVLAITLPIGISFYTFHALSYTIDVYRGTAPPVRSFLDFACYIALFPQLVAGPIIRYNTVADQLVSRSHTREKFGSGVTLFILGFAKKILLANPMGRVADAAFDARSLPRRMPGSAPWPTRSRSTSISPATPTWPSAWDGCSASSSPRTSIPPTRPRASRTSGGAGTSR